MKKKEIQTEDPGPLSAPPSAASRMLTPLDVQQKEFRVGTRGYKMRDVDEFLDQLTDAMSALQAENERLRAGAPSGPPVGTADLADTNRQADEIIQRARDEAKRIVAEARAMGAVGQPGGGGDAASPAGRAAITAFLSKEREFLQSLAGLVQGHAESMKAMAKSSRQAPDPAPAPSSTTPLAAAPASSAAEEPEPDRDAALDDPVVLDERSSAAVGRAEGEEPREGDSALRELFWGED